MWKPGQIVTIRGKVCRVKKIDCPIRVCNLCAFRYLDSFKYPCDKCVFEQESCKLPQGGYLEAINYLEAIKAIK